MRHFIWIFSLPSKNERWQHRLTLAWTQITDTTHSTEWTPHLLCKPHNHETAYVPVCLLCFHCTEKFIQGPQKCLHLLFIQSSVGLILYMCVCFSACVCFSDINITDWIYFGHDMRWKRPGEAGEGGEDEDKRQTYRKGIYVMDRHRLKDKRGWRQIQAEEGSINDKEWRIDAF